MTVATLKDVATEVGLSINTVSRVLNGKNKEVRSDAAGRAAAIRRVAQRLNYMPNAAGRAMQGKGTRQAGILLVNDASRRHYYLDAFEFILGIDDCLAKHGYVSSVIRLTDVDKPGSRVFREHVLDGLIVVGHHSADIVSRLGAFDFPVVWLDTNIWRPTGCIRLDDAIAGQMAAASLDQAGWRKLVFLTMNAGPHPHHSEIERSAAVEQYAAEHNIPFSRITVFGSSDSPDTVSPPVPAELAEALGSAQPGELGIVAYNGLHARRLCHIATARGRIPGVHFGLTCCDDNHEIRQTWPELSRMSVDRVTLGEMAADMFLQSLRTPQLAVPSRTVAGRWIEGTTSIRSSLEV